MTIRLEGKIVSQQAMWVSEITQRGDTFVLEEQSEMMSAPHKDEFDTLEEALQEMMRRT